MQHMKVGYAIYSKALCKVCLTNIPRHIIKIAIQKQQGDIKSEDSYHIDCLQDLPEFVKTVKAQEIDGFLSLKHEDQQYFMQRFEDLKLVESSGVRRNKPSIQARDWQQKKVKPNNPSQDRDDIQILGDKYSMIFDTFRHSLRTIGNQLLQEEDDQCVIEYPKSEPRQTDMIEFNNE